MKKVLCLVCAVLLVAATVTPTAVPARNYYACDAPGYIAWAAAACAMCIAASIWTYGDLSGCMSAVTPPAGPVSYVLPDGGKTPYEEPTRNPGDPDGVSGVRR